MNGDPIPLSALEHYCYCPRQCALILVDDVWVDSEHTVRGERGHRRADSGARRSERGRLVLRSVPLWSTGLGLTGRADVIEVAPGRAPVPVEFKIGTRHGDAADVQLCAQAMCLEEMTGDAVDVGYVWYQRHRRRERVVFDRHLRRRTLQIIHYVHELRDLRTLPAAPNDARCDECQLRDHCLPALVADPKRIIDYMRFEVLSCQA